MIVGSGAQILGPVIVGECARIGANAVVTRDVEPRSTMVGIPAKPVQLSRAEQGAIDQFVAYGTPLDVADPTKADNEALRDQIALLKARLSAIEFSLRSPAEEVPASPLTPGSEAGQGADKRAGD